MIPRHWRPGTRPQPLTGPAAGWLAVFSLFLVAALMSSARAADPLNTVRAFCQADGRGDRLRPGTWSSVAMLVAWHLEPAWDRVCLVRGYELTTPRLEQHGVDVEVTYTVAAELRPGGVKREEKLEKRTYHLTYDDSADTWRIAGPAPPPYIFASQVDAEAVAASLDPHQSQYVSASALVWRLLREGGWDFPYVDTESLAKAAEYYSVATAQAGDLVFYYDGGKPYHVGLVEEDQVVSATINAGVRRAHFAAFAGEVRYRRPMGRAQMPPVPSRGEESPTNAPTPPAGKPGG